MQDHGCAITLADHVFDMIVRVDRFNSLVQKLLQSGYGSRMAQQSTSPTDANQQRDELLRRALATPPISNEDILKRSKESHRK